ncbi:unnamed protein product [Zymoseptoria tritici ST99CH_1E4]|uniref:Uncharacterized protein n=1 Tax=Zymoseptoria tritici ST99CH_1E4 TaxID=1276532 RepID=A0A2H1GUJ7_ZYMTR|nr:unnamed protein product [Zymoseptoria tritici ST99CH_1E4]
MADSPQSPTLDDPNERTSFPPLARVHANTPSTPTRTTRSGASSNPRPKKKRKFSTASLRSFLRRSLRHVGLASKKRALEPPTAISPPGEEEEEEEGSFNPPSSSPNDSTQPPSPALLLAEPARPEPFGYPLHRCPKRLPKPHYLPFTQPNRHGYASYITTHWLPYLHSRLSGLSTPDRHHFLAYFLSEKCTSVCSAAQNSHLEKDYVWLIHRDAVLAWLYENPWAVGERTTAMRGAGRGGWRDERRERRGWVEGWGALREVQGEVFGAWCERGEFGEGLFGGEYGEMGWGFWEVGPRGEGVEEV